MKEITTEIDISSTASDVWKTLVDLKNWPNWNPIVNDIQGNVKLGETLAITMANSKGEASKQYKAIITEFNENERFSFLATMMAKFMFSAERIIELKPNDKGVTFIQREIYTGLMVSLFWKKLSTDALAMLNSMNSALKKEVEQS